MGYLKINYHFDANLWRYSGKGGWYFVTLPRSLSDHIKMAHGCSQSSWGRLKVNVTVSSDKWTTSLWYDTKLCSYLRIRHFPITNSGLSITPILIHPITGIMACPISSCGRPQSATGIYLMVCCFLIDSPVRVIR